MSFLVCVLDVYAENVKKILTEEFEAEKDPRFVLKFAASYDREEQLALAENADFLVVGWPAVDAEMIEGAQKLKAIHKWGIGYDGIDMEAVKARGIKLYITAGVNAVPVSELALLMMMTLLRRSAWADRGMRDGKWLKSEMRAVAHHLTHKKVGILGMGNIGKNLVKLLRGFDAEIAYHDAFRKSPDEENALGVAYLPFEELLRWCDVLSLHIPLTPETEHLIDASALEKMQPHAVLINTARGRLVDQQALVRALREGWIAGAGLDVFETEPLDEENPLLGMDNVVLTPHVGGATYNNVANVARHVRRNLAALARGDGSSIASGDTVLG